MIRTTPIPSTTIAAMLAVCAGLASASPEADLSLDQLQGQWASTSPAFGKPATASMHWEAALGGAFHRLEYRIFHTEGGQSVPVFEGSALYRATAPGAYEATWADSNGDLLPVRGEAEPSALVAHWGDEPAGRQGRTRYELMDDGHLVVTDWILQHDDWQQFNQMEFVKMPGKEQTTTDQERFVTGIGGVFFRGNDPAALYTWYEKHFAINPPPTSYDQQPWKQDAGYTVFGAFPQDTEYFGHPGQQWMINFRVRDLDGLIAHLREQGIEVSEPETHPQGRFARLTDPEGNPIELWEPSE